MTNDDVTFALPDGVEPLLGPYLGRQRWFAGSAEPDPGDVHPIDVRMLWSSPDGTRHLWWTVIEAEGARYQLLIGERRGGETAEFLSGREEAVLGMAGPDYFYDATVDPEMALTLLESVTDGAEHAERVRPVSAEQSNTSLVFDDRIIVKVFRRLADGVNPDVEVTTALAAVGFDHVAAPLGSWSANGVDLAFAQRFLAGGSEGWALALTSLRDFYNAEDGEPAATGGDFSGEAFRLGAMTAGMHLAMARAFGVYPERLRSGAWTVLIDDVEARLAAVADVLGNDLAVAVGPITARLRAVRDPGPALRVHGDYHLGQVMRTDAGWYVLDFEGEPARPIAERQAPASPLKDVTGMLRSFHYAARFALRERDEDEQVALGIRATAWEEHNRGAFLDGYFSVEGIEALLPLAVEIPLPGGPDDVVDAELTPEDAPPPALRTDPIVLAAYELDKALYELDYERAYRPEWVDIPTEAVTRILHGGVDGR